jgi:predicted PurR-regulated permease PerM
VIVCLVVAGLLTVFRAVEAVLVPLLVSVLVAYLLDPVVDRAERRGVTRTTAIALLMAAGVLFAVLFTLFLYPTIAHAIRQAVDGLPGLVALVQDDLLPWAQTTLGLEVPASLSQAMEDYGATVREQLPAVMQKLGEGVSDLWSRTGAIASSLVNLVMIPVFTFYFLRDFDLMTGQVGELLPRRNLAWTRERLRRMDEVVGAWFRGQVEVALILAGLYAFGLGSVFAWAGIGPMAGVAIGLLAGLLNIVPYFGFLIGFVLSVLMVLLEWSGPGPLAAVLVVFAVVQGLEGYVITPRVVGDKVGLSPVVVIIALLLGGELMGLLGVLLALPVAGIVRVLLPDIVEYYRSSHFYTGALHPEEVSPEPEPEPEPGPEPPRPLPQTAPGADAVGPAEAVPDPGAEPAPSPASEVAKEAL